MFTGEINILKTFKRFVHNLTEFWYKFNQQLPPIEMPRSKRRHRSRSPSEETAVVVPEQKQQQKRRKIETDETVAVAPVEVVEKR
ncbi:unnamed protein product [Diamesa serratosioi]